MSLNRYQETFGSVQAGGDLFVMAGASVTVRDESSGALAAIYSDRAGTTSKANPFTADANGYGFFYATDGRYRITATLSGETVDIRDVLLGVGVTYAGSVAELEALSLAEGVSVYLAEEGRAGLGVIKTGAHTSDPQKGIFIDIANGNYWERQFSGPIESKWFGDLQAFADFCPNNSIARISPQSYSLSDRVLFSGKNNLTVLSEGASFSVLDGSWTAFQTDDAPEIPDKKAVFVLSNCSNTVIEGGEIDGSGFVHTEGEDACGILIHVSDRCTVRRMFVHDVFPSTFADYGPETDNVGGVDIPLRYNGLIAMKSSNTVFSMNKVDNIKYDGITCRVACLNTKMLFNEASNCYEGLQATTRYGNALLSVLDPSERFNNHVLMMGNYVHDSQGLGAAIVTHARWTKIANNDVKDFTQWGISVRANGSDTTVTGNDVWISDDSLSETDIDNADLEGININEENIIVSNNKIRNVSVAIQRESAGLLGLTISSNLISRCLGGFLDDYSATTAESAEGVFTGNQLQEIFRFGAKIRSTRWSISGNSIVGVSAAPNRESAVVIDPDNEGIVTGVHIAGNLFRDFVSDISVGTGSSYELGDTTTVNG